MGGSDNQALHEILGARAHANPALAAAGLAAVGIDAGALEVAAACHRDGDVFHRYQVFQLDLAGVLDDLCAALVAETLLDFFEFLDNERAQNAVGAEDFEILGDAALDIGQLVEDLLLLHPGEALQLELDDGLRLLVAELEGGDEAVAGLARRLGGADDADDFVEMIEGLLEAEQDMLAIARLAELELGAPADHFDAVVDEEFDAIDQPKLARLPVDDGQHDDAEADLELGVLIEVVEDHLGLFAAFELEDDAHAVAVALVADIADAVDFLFVDQGGCGFDESRFVDLVGNLGDHDLLAVLGQFLDGGAGAQLQLAASGHVRLQDALVAQDEATGGKIGALHKLHDFSEGSGGMLDQVDGGVDDLGEVVGREIGRHADGDTAGPVDQEIGNARGENFGLLLAIVVVGFEIDGFLVDVVQQGCGHLGEACFGIQIGRAN